MQALGMVRISKKQKLVFYARPGVADEKRKPHIKMFLIASALFTAHVFLFSPHRLISRWPVGWDAWVGAEARRRRSNVAGSMDFKLHSSK